MSTSLTTNARHSDIGAAALDQTSDSAVDLDRLLDEQRTSGLQVRVAATCAAICFCDFFSVQAINYAAPSIRAELALNPTQLGAVLSLSLLGMMFGAAAIGPVADRFGRRAPLLALTVAFGVITAMTVLTAEFWHLAAIRFLDGLALGAVLPNAYVLAAEYSPKRNRRLTIGLLMVGYTCGGFTAGMVAGPMIAAFGWRSLFLVSGTVALLAALVAVFSVPESLHVLVARRTQRAEVERLISRISPQHIGVVDRLSTSPPQPAGASVRTLFNSHYISVTLGLWLLAFCVTLDIHFFLSWTTILLSDSGIAVEHAIVVTAMFSLGTLVAAVGTGWLMDRYQPAYILFGLLLFACAALGAMGLLLHDVSLLKLSSFAVGIGLGGGIAGMTLLATTVYPASARVTGSGWAIGVSRLGSVMGPAIGAAAVSLGLHGAHIYYAAIAPALLAAGVAYILARRVADRA